MIPKRLATASGFTLIELLVSMTLMIIVLSATLTTLDSGGANRRLNDDRNDSVEQARSAIDLAVRQLRNLASPSSANPSAIDRAQDYDFTFRTFDPNKRLVRYCLETDGSGSSAGTLLTTAARLIQMLSTTDAPGTYANCTLTTTGWDIRRVVAQNVVNHRGTDAFPLFAYNGSPANTSTINNVRIDLYIDINAAGKSPTPIKLASGAALRNQNQAPSALFTATQQPPSLRHFLLNATTSTDPENRNLTYAWHTGTSAGFTPSSSNAIGSGPVLDYTFGAANTYYFKLVVSDSNLTDTCPTSAGVKTNCTTAGPWVVP